MGQRRAPSNRNKHISCHKWHISTAVNAGGSSFKGSLPVTLPSRWPCLLCGVGPRVSIAALSLCAGFDCHLGRLPKAKLITLKNKEVNLGGAEAVAAFLVWVFLYMAEDVVNERTQCLLGPLVVGVAVTVFSSLLAPL